MSISEPRLRSLLRQARKVAGAGKRSAAVQIYRQIIEEAPASEEAWLGLASLLSDHDQQREAYERVLDLYPDNQEAQIGLARITNADPAVSIPEAAGDWPADDPFEGSRDWLEEATARSERPAEKTRASSAAETPPRSLTATAGPADGPENVVEASHQLVCYRHSNRETSLRCYSCDRPICSECAVKTPVGYRCPTCIREAEEVFFNSQLLDYVIAPLVSLPLSLLAGYLVLRFGGGSFFFIFLMLFIGGAIGGLIGRVAKRAVGRRRGRYLPHLVAFTVVLGVVLPVLFLLVLGARISLGSLLIPGIYLFVATSAAFYQMK